MKEFLWAVRFLTIIPLGREEAIPPERMGIVMSWYPVVGMVIGLCLLGVYLPLALGFPPELADALVIGFYVLITGALHLDGLADCMDGLLGGWDRARRLEIMKDSRIGSFGALALLGAVGLRYLSFHGIGDYLPSIPSYLPANISLEGDTLEKGLILFVMPVVGRFVQTLAAAVSTYAREESGTASALVSYTLLKHALVAAVLPVLLLWLLYRGRGIVIFIVVLLFVLMQVSYIKSRLGGMTGDGLGAVNETSELLFLLLFY